MVPPSGVALCTGPAPQLSRRAPDHAPAVGRTSVLGRGGWRLRGHVDSIGRGPRAAAFRMRKKPAQRGESQVRSDGTQNSERRKGGGRARPSPGGKRACARSFQETCRAAATVPTSRALSGERLGPRGRVGGHAGRAIAYARLLGEYLSEPKRLVTAPGRAEAPMSGRAGE